MLAWPQGHSHTGHWASVSGHHPHNRKPCPGTPLSHPMFPGVAFLLFPMGAVARNHALLREEAGPQLWAALPLTCSDPLPLVEALGPHPFLTHTC